MNLGIFKQAKYRLVLWFFLIAAVLLYMKFNVVEPFPKMAQRSVSLFSVQKYDEVVKLDDEIRAAYEQRYWAKPLGYYYAFSLREMGEIEQSQAALEEYLKKTTGAVVADSKRLMADNFLSLGKTEEGLTLLTEIYAELPHRSLELLKIIFDADPKFDPAKHLNSKGNGLALDILQAYIDHKDKTFAYSGKVNLPHKDATPLKNSLFFSVSEVKTTAEGGKTKVTGLLQSRITLGRLGFRITGFNTKDLYTDEKICTLDKVVKDQPNAFTCWLEDDAALGYVILEELTYEV